MDIQTSRLLDYRLELITLIAEQTLLNWRNYLYGDQIDVAQTFIGHEHLFTKETIDLARAERARSEGDEAHALLYFEHALIAEFIRGEVAPHDDKIKNTTAQAEIRIDGDTIPFRKAVGMLAQESDYERRQRIWDAAVPVLNAIEPVLLEREEDIQAIALQCGYDGYVELGEEVRIADFNQVAALVDRFIDDTDELYEGLVSELAPTILDISPVDLRRCDFERIFRATKWDRYFPADRILSHAKRILEGLGIHLREQKALHIYAEAWDGKADRPACFPIRVPGDVRISINPIGGLEDYRRLFHQLGYGQHYAGTKQTLGELRLLGPDTAGKTFAYLFGGLTESTYWLTHCLGIPERELDELRHFNALRKICFIRQSGAQLAYERWLRADGEDPRQRYADLMSEAFGVEFTESDSARYLIDADDLFYEVDALRAWFLHAQLDEYLNEKWGEAWFQNKEAGEFLQSLWANGQRYVAEELAGLWGDPIIRAEPLIRRIQGFVG